jgi:hypothetical protein
MDDIGETVPELYFLKYKGLLAPWEILAQAKRIGFKCKKYANWKDVHVTEDSRQLLKEVGSTLIDEEDFDLAYFPELSQVFEKVQRWAKDKERFSLAPDMLPEFESLSRIILVGSKNPNVVDLMIDEFGLNSASINIDKRWTLFIAICIYNYFYSKKRFEEILSSIKNLEVVKVDASCFIKEIDKLITELYLLIGFETSQNESKDVINLFISELGLPSEPKTIKRDENSKIKSLPKVWVEKFEGNALELVKFSYSNGDVFVKINKNNKIFSSASASELAKLLADESYWILVGKSIESRISQIDDVQDFYDTFSKNLRAFT